MLQESGRAVGREGYAFLATGVVLIGLTVGVLTTSRMSRAESATPASPAPTSAARIAQPRQVPASTNSRPATPVEVFNRARGVVGVPSLGLTSCATRAAGAFADTLPPAVPVAGSGWADAAVWCDGRAMSFGFQSGHDRTGVAMAAVEITGARRTQFTDASQREFGDVIVSIGSAASPEYVLVWSVG